MFLSAQDITELGRLQPELSVAGNRILGQFYLSASLKNKSKNRKTKLNIYPWHRDDKSSKNHLTDVFDVDIMFGDDLHIYSVFSEKILKWKAEIPAEYWHINSDNSLCLGKAAEIEMMQQQHSFSSFINTILSGYFYHMLFVKIYGKEPWKAHRHGLFAALELSCNDAENDLFSITLPLYFDRFEWQRLLSKTQGKKIDINGKTQCPFCRKNPLSTRRCYPHKKQIKGYNNLVFFDSINLINAQFFLVAVYLHQPNYLNYLSLPPHPVQSKHLALD